MLGNEHAAPGESPGDDRSNCWQSLKPREPQRGDETGPSVTVAKAEKILGMAYGASLRAATQWVFSSEAPNRGTFNDYPARE